MLLCLVMLKVSELLAKIMSSSAFLRTESRGRCSREGRLFGYKPEFFLLPFPPIRGVDVVLL